MEVIPGLAYIYDIQLLFKDLFYFFNIESIHTRYKVAIDTVSSQQKFDSLSSLI